MLHSRSIQHKARSPRRDRACIARLAPGSPPGGTAWALLWLFPLRVPPMICQKLVYTDPLSDTAATTPTTTRS